MKKKITVNSFTEENIEKLKDALAKESWYEVFKEKVDIDAKIAERVYEIKEAIISEYEEQKNREVKQAKEDIAKKLQDKYDNQSSIIKNLNVENQ